MTYALGIDIGTTFSSAAVHRGGRTQVVELGSRSAAVPSVVLLREDGVLAGEAAQRRATSEPRRIAREFKRRIGDPTPVLLDSTPYSAEALTARLLEWMVRQVTEREGGPPAAITISHPANWGPYKVDLLRQAVRLADLDDVALITEPEAAAVHYASLERVEPGSVIAVYDLGGGTFDAAILRKADGEGHESFEALGRPEGIERLGGIDFDSAVIDHVTRALDGAVESLDPEDPVTLQALNRLRQDCIEAKEALSGDLDCSIPVLLPTVQTEVRITRSEFETLIRPALVDSLAALRRAMRSAEVEPEDVSAVLLVGGSSRIPLVAQLVANEFGRPVAVDADPNNSVALGAALLAAHSLDAAAPTPEVEETEKVEEVAAAVDEPAPTVPESVGVSNGSRLPLLAGVGLALLVAAVSGYLVFRGSGGGPEEVAAEPASVEVVDSPDVVTEDPADDSASDAASDDLPDEPDEGPIPTPCPTVPEVAVCITDIAVEADGGLTATYLTRGYAPRLDPVSDHIHFYFDTVVGDDELNAGTSGSGGDWRLWDSPNPFRATGGNQGRTGYTLDNADAVGAGHLCSIVARPDHSVIPGSGNCIAIPRP